MSNKEANIRDYYQLLKPGVMSLIVFTSIAGFALSTGDKNIFLCLMVMLSISFASGGAAALNMWYDADIDRIMERTKKRPIPRGVIDRDDALVYGVVFCVISILFALMASNLLTVSLLIIAIIFYVFIYTIWLKRRTPQNIVIGGAAGSFPPLIAYASVSGSVEFESILLFLIIFIWTPPHFWSLALYRNSDYKKANIPMLPVVKGEKYTLKNILYYSIALVFVTFLLYFFSHKLGNIFLIFTLAANIYFMFYVLKLYFHPSDKNAMRCFFASIFYLFAIFLGVIIDSFF